MSRTVILCEDIGGPDSRCIQGVELDAECRSTHTPVPRGFLQHAHWAEEMLLTHDQQRCPRCGLWAIWVPRQPDPGNEYTI